MQATLGIVIFAVMGVAVVVAIASLVGRARLYERIGSGGLSLDRESEDRGSGPGGVVNVRERDEEIRQLLEARNARRVARGEPPLEVEAELARLTAPAIDPGLGAEVRELVIARNKRRARAGKPVLDVEAEVRRQLHDLGA